MTLREDQEAIARVASIMRQRQSVCLSGGLRRIRLVAQRWLEESLGF